MFLVFGLGLVVYFGVWWFVFLVLCVFVFVDLGFVDCGLGCLACWFVL